LRQAAFALIAEPMRYITMIVAVLICVGAHGCVTDKKLMPPESVLDPRGQ